MFLIVLECILTPFTVYREIFDHFCDNLSYFAILQKAPKFQPQFKNPCWHDENKLLRCLPYFYLIGAPKCGTTDLYNKYDCASMG